MTNKDISLESFIIQCDDMMIAEEGLIDEMGRKIIDVFCWIQSKLNEIWNKIIKYVSELKNSRELKCSKTHSLDKSYNRTAVRELIVELDDIFQNLETLVEITNYKFKRISHALLYSAELCYDSKEITTKSHSEIIEIIEGKYNGINRRCVSNVPEEISFDETNRAKIAKSAVIDIYERILIVQKILENLASDEKFHELYEECNSYMMKLFIPSIQQLKPLKNELNRTIEVLKKGVPIYSDNRTYSNIIHSIIGDASADWSCLNSLYVRVLHTFKSYGNINFTTK